jgi:hypothetical protein
LGWDEVPVEIADIHSSDPEFKRLLVEANFQRIKTADMLARESGILSDPKGAHERYRRNREKIERERDLRSDSVETIEVGARCRNRSSVSAAKLPMLQAAWDIIRANRKYWPLSVRQVHYRLLNNPPLKHARKPGSTYRNDRASYQDLCKILAAARVDGQIPFQALADETRSVVKSPAWDDRAPFIQRELELFLAGFRRNLLQDQDDLLVMVAEKLTVKTILEPICASYGVPLVITRGYPDIGTRYDLAQRFNRSGKRRMILLFVTDHDPEGVDIPHTFHQSLVEDVEVDGSRVISKRVAITLEQAEERDLPPNAAKEDSSRFDSYTERTGSTESWELEALDPDDLAEITRQAIESHIDANRFNRQVELENEDMADLLARAEAAKQFFQKRD